MKPFCINRLIAFFAAMTLVFASSIAQEIAISNTTLETCEGFLVDTGLSAGDYGPNEDITMTVCPEAPETIITLYWALANLGPGDILQIFDGPDDSAPLLGTYIEYEAQGLELFASEDNPTGCLTLHFTSDAAGEGSLSAEMSCGYPCERPFAIVESGNPFRIWLARVKKSRSMLPIQRLLTISKSFLGSGTSVTTTHRARARS